MTTASTTSDSLRDAYRALEAALARLEAGVTVQRQQQSDQATAEERARAELSDSWTRHSAALESNLANLAGENEFLKEDNLRLSNQLQAAQLAYLELQQLAGNVAGKLDASVRQLDLMLEH